MIIENEITQVKAKGLNCYKAGFFSKSGFECSASENLLLFELDDLFEDE